MTTHEFYVLYPYFTQPGNSFREVSKPFHDLGTNRSWKGFFLMVLGGRRICLF